MKSTKLTPAQQVVALKQQVAKLTKQQELTTNKLKQVYTSSNKISKEELDEVYDPNNPAATTDAINAFNSKTSKQFDDMLTSIDSDTEAYMKESFKPEAVDMETHLAQWAEQNNVDLSYEQLLDEVPNKILKKLKEEGSNPEEVFKEASTYIKQEQQLQPYNPTPTHNHSTGNQAPATTPRQEEQEDDGIY